MKRLVPKDGHMNAGKHACYKAKAISRVCFRSIIRLLGARDSLAGRVLSLSVSWCSLVVVAKRSKC